MFVDRVEIGVEAGKGGDGCVSFRREKYVPKGGPDGGDGGNGGSIIIRAEPGVDSLANLTQKHIWKAKRGAHGQGYGRHGKSAADITLRVPPGTMIFDAEHGNLLKDMSTPGEEVVIAQGGAGGKGNARFKSATNQAPRTATPGEPGEIRQLKLELKVIADVGLLGKPNAGKSTLLSRLSRARPEIADYPFTTKHPNLGIVQVDVDRSFVMADIPGLIEGAHAGVGLGLEFLKHVERTRVLVHLVEPTPMDGTDPIENYQAIREEIRLHDENLPGTKLTQRPEIIAVSKGELPDAEAVQELLAEETNQEVLVISAVTGAGLQRLTQAVVARLDATDE